MEWLNLAHTAHLWVFFLLVFGIVALPGLDMAFVLGSTLVDGIKGGLAALAGVVVGGVVHTAMAGLGVGLALQALPQLFNAMLAAGALYLAWIGWQLVRGAAALAEVRSAPSRPWPVTFRRGLLTCLLNPKAYLFMVAVFPQFVRPEYGSLAAQAVVMGAIISATQFAVYGAVALGGVRVKAWLRGSGRAQVLAGQGLGWLLVMGGVWTLWQAVSGVSMADSRITPAPADFDFIIGDRQVHHRRLNERLAGCKDWAASQGTSSTRKILGGYGNVEDNVLSLPEGDVRAVAFRTFDERSNFDAIHSGNKKRAAMARFLFPPGGFTCPSPKCRSSKAHCCRHTS